MSADDLKSTVGLEDAHQYMTAKEAELARMLLSNGQHHIFQQWKQGDHEKKHAFFRQVRGRSAE